MLGFIFTRARATESRTTQLARETSSQTLVHVASQVIASQTCNLPNQTRPCHTVTHGRGSHSGAEGKCPLRLSGDLSH